MSALGKADWLARRRGPDASWNVVPSGKRVILKKCILVVDDDETTRLLVASIIEGFGFDTVVASNGIEAMRHLNGNLQIALVVSDIQMPQLSGLGLRAKMLGDSRCHGIPVVLMSGCTELELPTGVTWLRKPFSLEELQCAIVACLGPVPVPSVGQTGYAHDSCSTADNSGVPICPKCWTNWVGSRRYRGNE